MITTEKTIRETAAKLTREGWSVTEDYDDAGTVAAKSPDGRTFWAMEKDPGTWLYGQG
jgi:hypothetical protein